MAEVEPTRNNVLRAVVSDVVTVNLLLFSVDDVPIPTLSLEPSTNKALASLLLSTLKSLLSPPSLAMKPVVLTLKTSALPATSLS